MRIAINFYVMVLTYRFQSMNDLEFFICCFVIYDIDLTFRRCWCYYPYYCRTYYFDDCSSCSVFVPHEK